MKRMHQTSWNGCFWGEFSIALWCQSQMSSTAMVPFENHRLWEDHLHHTVPAFLVTFFCNPRNLMLNCKWNASDSKTWSWITLGVHCFGIQQAKKIAAHRFQHVNTSMSFLSSKSAISFYNILHMLLQDSVASMAMTRGGTTSPSRMVKPAETNQNLVLLFCSDSKRKFAMR